MANTGAIFERIEKKYMLTDSQLKQFEKIMEPYMQLDAYGKYTVLSIYYDTPENLLIRRSIMRPKPFYKEKLRLRSYGVPTDDTTCFVELKKKYNGIVYKRRIAMPLRDARQYLDGSWKPEQETQIMKEIDYFLQFYEGIRPYMLVAYDRRAYSAKFGQSVRLTIDENIRARDTDVELAHGDAGELLLPPKTYIMEIKIEGAMPLWMSKALSELKIYPHRFSKVGTFYSQKKSAERGQVYHV